MRINSFLVIFLILTISQIRAKENNYGEYSVTFLKFAKGVRILGLGGGGVALSDSIDVIYSNPAGVANIEKFIIQGDYASWFRRLGIDVYQFLVSQPIGKKGVFGATCAYLSSEIEAATEQGVRQNNLGVSSLILGISLAQKYKKDWHIGGTLELIRENLAEEIGEGIAFNLGVLHHYTPNLTFGGVLRHLGPTIEFGANDYPLPRSIEIGISARPKILEEKVLFVSDLEKDKTGFCLKIGAEYSLFPIVSFRLGYNTTSGTSLGLSIYSEGEGSYRHLSAWFHYAYLLQHRTKLHHSSHHLSLAFFL